jgi:hypothetical protein
VTGPGRCRVCGRPLPRSRTGIGPVCARRLTGPTRRPRPATVRGNDDPVPVIPGQTELPLALHQPSLWSL